MKSKATRLFFIDAMRAWAILMMLQGHFVDGLLDTAFRDASNSSYSIWQYFRGITAPVFFTVSGFIFTFLLIRVPQTGLNNPRVKKGIKRGLQLLFIGYLLRTNLFGLLNGDIYDSFYLVDVLHCIGLSILGIIGIYLLTHNKRSFVFPTVLVLATCALFIFEPYYKQFGYSFLPQGIANYFTKANGSVFTIIPWFGYAALGGFLSVLFTRYRQFKYLYPSAITIATTVGLGLIFYSSDFFLALARATDVQLFADIYFNNYLFIRLGDVLVVFAIFMLFRRFMTHSTVLKIGQSTLSIYVIHFIILYGSFTGLGLYRFLDHSLSPWTAIPGALAFILVCTYAALQYERNKEHITLNIATGSRYLRVKVESWATLGLKLLKVYSFRGRMLLLKLFRFAKN
ncbi:heparan-alpha-glucosaminide N-acetyltransferase domain-containing protein [Flavobacteriaceae bacterium 3-367]|uniref:heparan-alpha-glucosaminide N-acetyltransferase domain-containing protein n=1 Tax=Eudoraea algarum TaxID=3417568 RepID=UPI00327B87B6